MEDINMTLLVFCCLGWLGFLGTWLGVLFTSLASPRDEVRKRGFCPDCGQKLKGETNETG